MLAGQEIEEEGDADEHVEDVTAGDDAQGDDTTAHGEVSTVTQEPSIPSHTPTIPPSQPPQDIPSTSQVQQTPPQSSQRVDTSDDTVMDDESNQGRMIDEMDKDDVVVLMDEKEEDKKVDESAQVQGRQAESQAKIYKIDMDHASKVLSMQEDEPAEMQEVVDVVTTAKLITKVVTAASETVTAASVIISAAEPQVPAATINDAPTKVAAAPSRRRKRVVIRDPEEESTTSSIISTETKSKDKGKGIMVEDPKPLKKKQQIEMDEEYARKLHAEINKDIEWDVAIDHVKLKAKEDPAVQRYQTKEQIEEEENRALQSINETPAQKAAKRRKLNEKVKDLKRHLEIVPDEDDDVYTEATPLARKVPVVDYKIIELNNKPFYKIIRADGTHHLVKEKFSTSKPKNFFDDFILTTLGAMFEKPDAQAQVWNNQMTIHGQAKVKSWKLLESCGVHIITFTTTQQILLIERRSVKIYKTIASRRPARMMVEYILHQAQEQDLDQAS
uniref:Uncharacterized protein n=1 Tax=Tanacetum cinerariifolium TaxID=118510 RepID=A0A699IAZ9_TANCI|nr:hypothetical protein [Tanacetum cinerariifolium]